MTNTPKDIDHLQPSFSAIAEYVYEHCADKEDAKAITRAILRAMNAADHGMWSPREVTIAVSLASLFTAFLTFCFIH